MGRISSRSTSRLSRLLRASLATAFFALGLPAAVVAQSTSPSPSAPANSDVTIEAHALLGGHVRPGSWAAVNVVLTNAGPAIDGELRIRASEEETRSQYGVEVNLPTGARQQFTLYGQTALFGSRVFVDLVSGDRVAATQAVAIRSHDAYVPIVAVISESPERILADVTEALVNPNAPTTSVITLTAADLPPRVEAWVAIDRLIWQDVDTAMLGEEQLEALRLWVGAGGQLVVVGGSTGTGVLDTFAEQGLLPFTPARTIDVPAADLTGLLGELPTDTPATSPAAAGTLARGAVLARSGDEVIAAQAGYGRGTVALIGIDPGQSWLADTAAAGTLWRHLLPTSSTGPALNPLQISDDSQIVFALQNLPAVSLPPVEQLLVLLVAYIALVGPINYLVLRRLDRREWAWVTIPALVGVFAFGSYGLGATLKGSDVIVNEIAVVRAAQDSGRGIGQVYVGIYSPTRRSFEVSIPGGALISNPTNESQQSTTQQPLDVVLGSATSRLRNFEVGFGVLRGFRAEAPADSPKVDSNLRLSGGKLQGEITNRSDSVLENLAVVFGGAVAVVPRLDPGASQSISLDTGAATFADAGMSERVFGSTFPRDPADARVVYTRRTVLDQLFPYGSSTRPDAPLLLAWRGGPVLDVQLSGDDPNRVGDALFMIPLGMSLDAKQVFANQLVTRSVIDSSAAEGWYDGNSFFLSRGTMTVEARPGSLAGRFVVSSLEIALSENEMRGLNGDGEPTSPLPASEQPDPDDPLGENPTAPSPGPSGDPSATDEPDEPGPGKPLGNNGLPAYQLFDRVAQTWVEFPHPQPFTSYVVNDPQRYADDRGAVLFRFVNRGEQSQFGEEQQYFQLSVRMEGAVQ